MIYYCEKCHFLFSRSGEVDACVDCASASVRQANDVEAEEYKRRLEQTDRIWNSDE